MSIKGSLLLFAAILLLPIHCFCWGFYAHQKINYQAVFLLPPQMLAFYKPHLQFLSDHAVDPDKRRYVLEQEGPRHYIDLDHYGAYPFDSLPRRWDEAVARYSEDTLQRYGIAPWWLQVMHHRLVAAFKDRHSAHILKLSAEIGHYMADIHVPLHVSSNHNGQLTGQQGIHGFWESRLPELLAEREWNFFIGRASYIANLGPFIWQRVLESARAADTVLRYERELSATFPHDQKFAFETRGGAVVRQYSSAFATGYDRKLHGMVERRMRQSIEAVASFWFTAWVDAGQPDLATLSGKEFGEEEVKELEELNRAWKINSIKGREHQGFVYFTTMRGFMKSVLGVAALLVKFTTLHASGDEHGPSTKYRNDRSLHPAGSKLKGHRKAKLVRGPYLQMVSGQGATLRWRTDIATDSKVDIGTIYGHYLLSTVDTTQTTEHEVRLRGLTPDTRYYYRLGSRTQVLQGSKENHFTTAPLASTTRRIGVAVFGDCGANDKLNRTLALAAYRKHTRNNPADLMLLLGDNAYRNGLDREYQKKFFRPFSRTLLKNHALFPAPGNHEYANDPARQKDHDVAYYSIFSVPRQGECGGVASGSKSYYSYNWGNIHFVSLDSYGEHDSGTTRLYDTLGAQVQWLKKDLAANRQQWTVVYWHHPPYTMGSHNSDTETELVRIRENFLRVLERYSVDLVITGHSHNYERSYLLNGYYGGEASFAPQIHARSTSSGGWDGGPNSCPYTTDGSGANRGTVYVVAGSSGASGHVADSYPHSALPFAHNTGGMFYFEVEGNRLDARFLRKNGSIGDRFSIVKDVTPTHHLVVQPGDSTVLTAGWSGTYRWSTGASARSIAVAPLQDSTYRVEDPQGCLSQTFRISVKPVGSKVVSPGE